MRLWSEMVSHKFKNFAESQMDNKTRIWDFYQAYTMSFVALGIDVLDKDKINKFWKLYVKTQQYKNRLEQMIDRRIFNKDLRYVNKFLREKKDKSMREVIDIKYGGKGVIGIASYFYDE